MKQALLMISALALFVLASSMEYQELTGKPVIKEWSDGR